MVTLGRVQERRLSPKIRLVRPYVVDQNVLVEKDAEAMMARIVDFTAPQIPDPFLLDLPFPEMWFEATSSGVPSWLADPSEVDPELMSLIEKSLKDAAFFFPIEVKPRNAEGDVAVRGFETVGFAIYEDVANAAYDVEAFGGIATHLYRGTKACGRVNPEQSFLWVGTMDAQTVRTSRLLGEICNFLQRLFALFQSKHVVTGVQVTSAKIAVGRGASAPTGPIKEVVHLTLREQMTKYPAHGASIDWSHRWEVAGHWRRIRGVGKDRTGRYLVPGATWVRPHEKGKELVAAVRKTRVPPRVPVEKPE